MHTRGIRLVLFPISLLIIGFILIVNDLYAAPNSGEERFHKLFLWKVSEELKLSVEEEKKLSEFVLKNYQNREATKREIKEYLSKMEKAKKTKAQNQLLRGYKTALSQLKESQVKELEGVHNILGTQKALSYVLLQNKLNEKLKALLSDPSQETSKKSFSKPKVIEGN